MKARKTGGVATWLFSLGALAAGIVFGILPNGGFAALLPTQDPEANPNTSNSGKVTATGEAIVYPYGKIRLSVTRDNGQLTAIGLVQAEADNGRDEAFPKLQQAALDANGSSFANVGGASYTSDAFRLALESALGKLP